MADEEVKLDETGQEETQDTTQTKESVENSATPKDTSVSSPQINIDSIKESITKDVSGKISKEVSNSVLGKIADALGLNKKEEDKLPNDADSLVKVIEQKVEEKLRARDEQENQKSEQDKQRRDTEIKTIISGWNSQYDNAARLGKVPAIKNASDPNDQGVLARKRIITQIGKMIDQNRQMGSDYTPTISDVLLQYPRLDEIPGADLPISGDASARESSGGLDYKKDIKGLTFQEIVDRA